MIRVNKQLNIALSPLSLSPCDHKRRSKEHRKPAKLVSGARGSISSAQQDTPENKRVEKRMNNLVGQTSIEDLSVTNMVLNSSIRALANEKSPRSPHTKLLSGSSSNLEEDGPEKPGKLRNYLEDVLQLEKEASRTDEFNRVMDIRTINLDKENSFESSNLLQSKRIDPRDDLEEMDEAEIITDSRPQRRYDKDDAGGDERGLKA